MVDCETLLHFIFDVCMSDFATLYIEDYFENQKVREWLWCATVSELNVSKTAVSLYPWACSICTDCL